MSLRFRSVKKREISKFKTGSSQASSGDFLCLVIRTTARSLAKGIRSHSVTQSWTMPPPPVTKNTSRLPARRACPRREECGQTPRFFSRTRERNDGLHLSLVSKPSPEPHLPEQFTCCLHLLVFSLFKYTPGDFPGGPVIKNPPSNAGHAGWIPGWGTKIPHAVRQLSLHTTRE